jgi:hypothetical protein
MPDTPALVVQAEPARNLLRLRYAGHATAAAFAALPATVTRVLPQLRPGFTVLTDLTGLESMELECARHITRTMDLCRAAGIGTTVRVIPDPAKDIGLNILALTHYRGAVRIVTCRTLAEAEQALPT